MNKYKYIIAATLLVAVALGAALGLTASNLSDARSEQRQAQAALVKERAATKSAQSERDAAQDERNRVEDELYESKRFGDASGQILGVVVETLELCEQVSGVEVESVIICDKLAEVGPIAEQYNAEGGTSQ